MVMGISLRGGIAFAKATSHLRTGRKQMYLKLRVNRTRINDRCLHSHINSFLQQICGSYNQVFIFRRLAISGTLTHYQFRSALASVDGPGITPT